MSTTTYLHDLKWCLGRPLSTCRVIFEGQEHELSAGMIKYIDTKAVHGDVKEVGVQLRVGICMLSATIRNAEGAVVTLGAVLKAVDELMNTKPTLAEVLDASAISLKDAQEWLESGKTRGELPIYSKLWLDYIELGYDGDKPVFQVKCTTS